LSEADILKAVGRVNPFAGVATVRQWRFDRTNGQWAVNNQLYDGAPRARIQKGNGEIWILQNNSGGWMHPVHVHFEEFRVLYRANGQKPGLNSVQGGREDTLSLGPGERAVVFLRFRDFVGKYVMHCHNTVHEDHAMMVRWDIVE
jgi:FtsP/CotA-like multicopper oxidase with cupredoxin domain